MHIKALQLDSINSIQPLWEQLNALHGEYSTHFRQFHQTFTFSERIKKLHDKENLIIFTAFDEDVPVGYCIVSLDDACGEIDSLFVAPDFRKQGIGGKLMQNTLQWLKKLHCMHINVLVAEGNEKVSPFYERFGFKPKATMLKLLDTSAIK